MKDDRLSANVAVFCASFCARHMQHARPFVYWFSGSDAKLTVCETREHALNNGSITRDG